MSHCGKFYYDDRYVQTRTNVQRESKCLNNSQFVYRYVHGCLQSCGKRTLLAGFYLTDISSNQVMLTDVIQPRL